MKPGERNGFSRLAARAYLNHAAISPLSDAVCERVAEANAGFATQGAGAFGPWIDQRERLRQKLAALIGAQAEDIAFVSNTGHGLCALAASLAFNPGERIVLFDGEYPSNVSPFLQAAKRWGLQVAFVPAQDFAQPDGPDYTRLDAELVRGARLVAVSAVQFQTGLRMPVAEIGARAHAAGAELCVDAVQACGAVPVSVADDSVDYLACGSHKWLMGPAGAGFLYIHPSRRPALIPAMVGSMSHVGALDMLFAGPGHLDYGRPLREDAAVLEGGMLNVSGLAGLEAALDPLLALGVRLIHGHVNSYHDRLEPELTARGFRSLRMPDSDRRSCILSVEPPSGDSAMTWVDRLGACGVVASYPDGRLRFSPHWPNNAESEIPIILAALDGAPR